MLTLYTEEQVIAGVGRLTRSQLVAYIDADLIRPLSTNEGLRFRPVDLSRLELICDLTEDYGLADEPLGLVVALIDRLHAAHADLDLITQLLADEPREVRTRIGSAFRQRRG